MKWDWWTDQPRPLVWDLTTGEEHEIVTFDNIFRREVNPISNKENEVMSQFVDAQFGSRPVRDYWAAYYGILSKCIFHNPSESILTLNSWLIVIHWMSGSICEGRPLPIKRRPTTFVTKSHRRQMSASLSTSCNIPKLCWREGGLWVLHNPLIFIVSRDCPPHRCFRHPVELSHKLLDFSREDPQWFQQELTAKVLVTSRASDDRTWPIYFGMVSLTILKSRPCDLCRSIPRHSQSSDPTSLSELSPADIVTSRFSSSALLTASFPLLQLNCLHYLFIVACP